MKAEFDFSNVESNEFKPLTEGIYPAYLYDTDLRETKNGDDMYVLVFKVSEESEASGRQLYLNLPVMQKTMWKIKEVLNALGVDTSGQVQVDFDELLGTKVNLDVGNREYQGKVYDDVRKVYKSKDQSGKNGDVPF